MMVRALIALALFGATAPVSAQVIGSLGEMANTPVVTIHSTESVRSRPDRATVHVGVNSVAPTASQALAENSTRMERVVAAVRRAGIPPEMIQTSGINLNPRHNQADRFAETRIIGYEASNTLRVATRDIAGLGRFLDALVSAGATNISGPYFSLERADELEREAKRRALARADSEATFYAQARGYASARLISIEESPRRGGDDIIVTGSRIGGSAGAAPPVEPGEVSVGVTLAARYILVR